MFYCLVKTGEVATIITTVAIALLIGVFITISGKKFDTVLLAGAAVAIGLSFGLSYIRVFEMPYGGSITIASFVPLIIFSYIYGIRGGLFAGIIYGLLQFIAGPYFLTPVQFLLDYILAFASIAAAGAMGLMFRKNHKAGLIVSVPAVYAIRLIIHILAGLIFYASVTMRAENIPIFGDTNAMSGLVYSSLYNGTYVIPDMIICEVVIVLMTLNKSFLKLIGNIYAQYNKDLKFITDKAAAQEK